MESGKFLLEENRETLCLIKKKKKNGIMKPIQFNF